MAAGIASAQFLPVPAWPWLIVPATALLPAWFRLRRSAWALLPLMAAVALIGHLSATAALQPPADADHIVRQIDRGQVAIEGELLSVAPRWDGSSRADVAVRQVIDATGQTPATGRVRLYVRSGRVGPLPGQTVRWRAPLDAPRNFGTPGEFDQVLDLAAQGIHATARLKDATQLVTLAGAGRPAPTRLATARAAIAAAIDRAVPPAERGLVKALTIGQRGEVTPAQRRQLSEAGVSHLFAISGLHFGLLALLLYSISSWLYRRSSRLMLWSPPGRCLPLLLLFPLAGYLLLSGNALPTRRAFLMAALTAGLLLRDRRTPGLQLLATVALMLLAAWPLALFQPAFQLSCAGLLGILVLVPRWQAQLPERPRWLRITLLLFMTTLAANLTTAPLVLWHFHQVAPAGLLSNLLAIPLIGWGAVPAGLLGVAALPVATGLAEFAFALAGAQVALGLEVVTWLSSLPGLKAGTWFISPAQAWALSALLGILLLPGGRRHSRPARAALGLLALALWLFPAGAASPLTLTALSVGQGDATLLSFDRGEHFLIDGGGWPGATSDPGERLVAPALGRLGVRRLHGVILTHNHPDHREGLAYLLATLPVDGFWTAVPATELPEEFQAILRQRQVPVHRLSPGWTLLPTRPGQQLALFTPDQGAADGNERSLAVFAAAAGSDGVLLTGDMGRRGLSQLQAAGLPGPVALLKIPHHGSRHSAPELFLAWLQPELALVSAGYRNRYGFPHVETLAACAAQGVELLRTDLAGSLQFDCQDGRWRHSSNVSTLRH